MPLPGAAAKMATAPGDVAGRVGWLVGERLLPGETDDPTWSVAWGRDRLLAQRVVAITPERVTA